MLFQKWKEKKVKTVVQVLDSIDKTYAKKYVSIPVCHGEIKIRALKQMEFC